MTRIWVPGYDEVLDLLERYQKHDKNVERAKDKYMSICWKQTSYIRKDPIGAYQEAPALQRYIELRESRAEELCRQIDKIKPLEKQILTLLDVIEGIEWDVITAFYIEGKRWIQVQYEMERKHKEFYSDTHLQNIRNRAIAKMAEKLVGDKTVG